MVARKSRRLSEVLQLLEGTPRERERVVQVQEVEVYDRLLQVEDSDRWGRGWVGAAANNQVDNGWKEISLGEQVEALEIFLEDWAEPLSHLVAFFLLVAVASPRTRHWRGSSPVILNWKFFELAPPFLSWLLTCFPQEPPEEIMSNLSPCTSRYNYHSSRYLSCLDNFLAEKSHWSMGLSF